MFGPPEVITGRLMSGAGAAPMVAASAEYTAAAAAYEASIDRLVAQLAYLSGTWQGEASMAMQRAVMQFIVWMRMLQTQVMAAATRTGSQAAAFTEAYTTMAQMFEIVENRVTTQVLHWTNFLGQNTIPIGVREGQYQQMWAQDVAVQTNYLAQTVANTEPVPFMPSMPITGITSFPPVVAQAINSAMAAGDQVMLAAINAQNTASLLKAKVGAGTGMAGWMAQRAERGAEQAEAQAAVDRNQQQSDPSQKMAQQLIQQVPQQVAQIGQQLVQLPQQAIQQGQQVGQQFSSQLSSLMGQVAPEHQLENPGFFDTHPTSNTLDQIAGSSSGGGITAAVRVPGLGGLSGINTGFRFPSGWEAPIAASAPPAPPAASGGPGGTAAGGRPMGGLHGGRRRDDEKATVKRPDTELIPMWGHEPEDEDTVSAGALAAGGTDQEASQ
ncbi:PPE protein [Mycolicibacterium rhodesiae JS60]|nr:PPE protein [Mycolicibacterium rhodesiae JS60]